MPDFFKIPSFLARAHCARELWLWRSSLLGIYPLVSKSMPVSTDVLVIETQHMIIQPTFIQIWFTAVKRIYLQKAVHEFLTENQHRSLFRLLKIGTSSASVSFPTRHLKHHYHSHAWLKWGSGPFRLLRCLKSWLTVRIGRLPRNHFDQYQQPAVRSAFKTQQTQLKTKKNPVNWLVLLKCI